MYKSRNRLIITAVLASNLFFGLSQATMATGMYEEQHNERSAGAMAVDVLAVRPLGFVATVLGTGLFVVSLPFSALGGNMDEAAQNLVVKPARFTFVRPLGEYEAYR
ncbi:MAG: hypothetical protein ACREVE_10565 [Gammaproteobacteria bacterium]